MKLFKPDKEEIHIQEGMGSISESKLDENDDHFVRTKSCFDILGEQDTNSDTAYSTWLKKHPSALRMFDKMMAAAKGKTVVVFLDYDGTLSPIVDNPSAAFMSDRLSGHSKFLLKSYLFFIIFFYLDVGLRSAVRDVARYFPTAIISGRSRDKVFEFVKLTGVYYAGSHGMDIMAPVRPLRTTEGQQCQQSKVLVDELENQVVLFQPAREFLPAIQEIIKVLEEKTKDINGAVIEDNRFCVSVHFRRVQEEDFSTLEEIVNEAVKDYPSFHITRGRKVLEIRPSIKWDKGHALDYLLETLGFQNSPDVLPLYIGDDRTDEDAFKVLRMKEQAHPILVSSIPKETKACYSLRDPSEVMSFLLRLARWRRNSSSGRIVF